MSGTGKIESRAVVEAIRSRRSIRGFLKTPVPREAIVELLEAARRAPSANNTQPWRVYVLTGAAKERLSAAILSERATGADEPPAEYQYYSGKWPEPYQTRRRTLGYRLYDLLGIAKGDRAAARRWHDRNFEFFGAPVGMIFTVERSLAVGSYMDVAMFVENILIGARGLGLDTCPQAAFANYHATIRRELSLSSAEIVVCGLSLGYADHDAVPNTLQTDREPLENFATFLER
jgi:nitroreductase